MNQQLSPDAMKLKAIRANLAAIESGDWTVVHDDEGYLVVEAIGPMAERHWRLCRFDRAASKDEMALISSAPETVRFLLDLVDRATRALRQVRGEGGQRGHSHGEVRREPVGRDKDFAAEAAMLCDRPVFMAFLEARHGLERPLSPEKAAQKLRTLCGVTSRREFNNDERAAAAWRQLRDDFKAWERAGR